MIVDDRSCLRGKLVFSRSRLDHVRHREGG